MAYFPMYVDMTERECLIVGGGNVAMDCARTIKRLRSPKSKCNI